MARPIQADPEATQRRILVAAGALFSEQGAGDTSMRQIASAAQVSLATLHYYFGGKQDLYRACIRAMNEEVHALRQELEQVFLSSADPLQVMELAVRRAYGFILGHRLAVQLLMRDVLDTGELNAEDRAELQLPLLERSARLLAPLLGQPPAQVRLTLISIIYLMVRFALNTPQEQCRVAGLTPEQAASANGVVADHLVQVARRLLGWERGAQTPGGSQPQRTPGPA